MTTQPERQALADSFEPVRKTVEIRCSPEHAFEIFTRSMGAWWPLETHSVYGEDAEGVDFGAGIGAEIIETSRSGESCSWGTISEYEPGQRLAFSWHPGDPPEQATEVVVRFAPIEGGTLVELIHGGWEQRDQPQERRDGYERGWNPVLASFVSCAASPVAAEWGPEPVRSAQ